MSIRTATCRMAALIAGLIFFSSRSWRRIGQGEAREIARHGEWVEVKHGNRNVRCFLVFPEVRLSPRQPRRSRPRAKRSSRRLIPARARVHASGRGA